jgi:copper(I)-binding protein
MKFNLLVNRLALLAACAAALGSGQAHAQTTVAEPWVRGTVAQQKSTGLFAQITSAKGGKLVSASSPVAGVVEIHEMSMDGNVMRMRALPQGLELPAGKVVTLRPGGFHLMLQELKQPLQAGDMVVVTLVVQAADGTREVVEVKAPVRALNAAPAVQHKH